MQYLYAALSKMYFTVNIQIYKKESIISIRTQKDFQRPVA